MKNNETKNTSCYKLFVKTATVENVLGWLTPGFGKFTQGDDTVIDDVVLQQYNSEKGALLQFGATPDQSDQSIITIEIENGSWEDHMKCADDCYENLGLTVMCDGGFPEMFFMWYIRNNEGVGFIDPSNPRHYE